MAIRPFVDTLRAIRFGALEEELAAAMADATIKVRDAGKAGTVTLKIKLTPGKGGQIEIDDDITVKLPKMQRETTLMFDTVEGNLQRDDPRQASLPGLRTVIDHSTGEIKPANQPQQVNA